jgi:hypothetical protein
VVDNYLGDFGVLNSWGIEICEDKTVTNSTLVNNTITVGTNTTYFIAKTDVEASSLGSTASEQLFMLTQLPIVGSLKLNGTPLLLGETFTQNDIDLGKISYSNTSFTTTSDSFKVDITNNTSGFLPNQEINITIDAALNLSDNLLSKYGINIYPTISNGYFSITSKTAIGKTTIELYNLVGQKVFIDVLDFFYGNSTQVNANRLAPGVYILKLNAENIQGTKKIVIK